MNLFDEFGHLQSAVGMGQPMQIDTKCLGIEFGKEGRHIEIAVVHHAQSQIDDPYLEPAFL